MSGLPGCSAKAFAFSTLLTRWRILLLWKQNLPPSIDDWLRDEFHSFGKKIGTQ